MTFIVMVSARRREGTSNRNRIGSMGLNHNRQNPGTPSNRVRERIRAWAEHNDFDAVIWTALEANFDERTGETFSPEAALHYLDCLPDSIRTKALEYIRNAPQEVVTPFRQKVA
jgi:hypothetical protein